MVFNCDFISICYLLPVKNMMIDKGKKKAMKGLKFFTWMKKNISWKVRKYIVLVKSTALFPILWDLWITRLYESCFKGFQNSLSPLHPLFSAKRFLEISPTSMNQPFLRKVFVSQGKSSQYDFSEISIISYTIRAQKVKKYNINVQLKKVFLVNVDLITRLNIIIIKF